MYLLKEVKVNMYQNGVICINRGKEGWLNVEVAPQLLYSTVNVHATDEHSKLNASFLNFLGFLFFH